MDDIKFRKVLVLLNCLVPFLLMLWDFRQNRLGINPTEFLTRTTGLLTLIFLFVTLAVTPLRKLTGLNWLVRLRRIVGLSAFFYGTLQLLTYLSFDRGWALSTVPGDVRERPFIMTGMAAFLVLVPLAVTSTNAMIKRLGKNWGKLHKLIYPAAIAGVWHYYMLVKADTTQPVMFALVLALLLAYRISESNRVTKRLPTTIAR
jgi:sulfoxide reductase heme-binding subunit YedZ